MFAEFFSELQMEAVEVLALDPKYSPEELNYYRFEALFREQVRRNLVGPAKLYIPHHGHGVHMDDVYKGIRLDVVFQARNKLEAIEKLRLYLSYWRGAGGQPIDILHDAYHRVLIKHQLDGISDVLSFEELFEDVIYELEYGIGLVLHEAQLF